MGAKTSAYDNSLLQLIFNGITFSGLAQNVSSGAVTTFYVSLHTASPGISGSQTTNEATYGGYARIGIARTSGGWVVTGSSVSPAANVVFPEASSGNETETYWGVGTAAAGAGNLLYFGPINPQINVGIGVQPVILTNSTITES